VSHSPAITQWAQNVMAAITSRPLDVRLGAWSEHDRDAILRALVAYGQKPADHFELIVDDGRANWRLKPARRGDGLRLADYRMGQIGKPEDPAVVEINDLLARLG
jgi:hypothetical protein